MPLHLAVYLEFSKAQLLLHSLINPVDLFGNSLKLGIDIKGFLIFLLAKSNRSLATQYTDELLVVSDSIQHLSGNLMCACDILYGLILLTFLAALLRKNGHHSGSVNVFHTHDLEGVSSQLLIFTLCEKLIKVLDFANNDLRGHLLILELLYKYRFIESFRLNHDVIGLLCFNEETIFRYL